MIQGVQCLVQFKLRPEILTAENVQTNVFLSSMVDSPIDSLYYLIKSIFSPALRDTGGKSSGNQQIQSSLNELEQMLRSTSKKGATANVLHPKDEISFWNDVAKGGGKDSERARYFLTILDPVRKDLTNFDIRNNA